MTTLAEPEVRPVRPTLPAADRLRLTSIACRVHFTWLGVRKTLTPQQKAQAAEPFDASAPFLSAGKRLFDTKHPAFRKVTAIRLQVVGFWKSMTLPFPEPGVRLIRDDRVAEFDSRMREFQIELTEAVEALDRRYDELKVDAAQRLGRLFDPADYPVSLLGLFGIEHDFPNIEPPTYLQTLHPAIYEQERQRIEGRFSEAVHLAECAFTEELARLVSHLRERLTDEGGGRKVFRNSAVGNMLDFFERFRSLSIGSNEDLDRLVAEAQRIVQGVEVRELRTADSLRAHVATELAKVEEQLDGMLVDRPRRVSLSLDLGGFFP